MKKRITLALLTIFVLYLGVYAILSAMGGYYVEKSGKIRYAFGLAFPDVEMFHPKWTWFDPGFIDVRGEKVTQGNVLGYLFSPLIVLDRKFIHKTVVLIEPPKNVGGGDASPRAGGQDK